MTSICQRTHLDTSGAPVLCERAMENVDRATVEGFGDEWSRFDQQGLTPSERRALFDAYFGIFPPEALVPTAVGADFGCGSGRWALEVAPRVKKLYVLDASVDALEVARRNLAGATNVELVHASISEAPMAAESL